MICSGVVMHAVRCGPGLCCPPKSQFLVLPFVQTTLSGPTPLVEPKATQTSPHARFWIRGAFALVAFKQGLYGRRCRRSRLLRDSKDSSSSTSPASLSDQDIDWIAGPSGHYTREKDRQILSLAVPAVASSSIDPLLSIVDAYWISSRVGTTALASLGPALTIDDWIFDILKTIQIPIRSLTSKAMASGDADAVRQSIFQGLCLSVRIGVFVAVAGSLCSAQLLWLSAVSPSSALFAPARAYLVPRLWGTPGLLALLVLQATLSGAFKDTRKVLRLVLLGAVVNSILTPALVIFTQSGTAGAALGTTVACYVMAVAAWRSLMHGPQGGRWVPRWKAFVECTLFGRNCNASATGENDWTALLQANVALTIRSFSSLTTWLVASALLTKRTNMAQLAAHLCTAKVFLLLLNLMYGFQLSVQVLVSEDVVRGCPKHARWTIMRTLRLSIMASALAAGIMWTGRGLIASFLTSDAAVIAEFSKLAAPAAIMLLQYGIMWILDGVLYGLGDYVWLARAVTAAATVSVVVMFYFGYSACSIWWCLNTLALVRSVGVVYRVFLDAASPLAQRSDSSPSNQEA